MAAAAMRFLHLTIGCNSEMNTSRRYLRARSASALNCECGVKGVDHLVNVLGLGDER